MPTTRISLDHDGGSAVGEQAPAFTVTTTTGETVRLPAGKPAVLSFATAWCSPVVETAALAAIARELGPRVAVLGVGVDPSEPLADLDGFAARFGGGYGYVQDGDGTLSTALGVRTLDSTVVLDPGGRIVWRDPGPTDEATLRAALAQAGLA
jgi:peroxiredoxin